MLQVLALPFDSIPTVGTALGIRQGLIRQTKLKGTWHRECIVEIRLYSFTGVGEEVYGILSTLTSVLGMNSCKSARPAVRKNDQKWIGEERGQTGIYRDGMASMRLSYNPDLAPVLTLMTRITSN